MFDIVKTFVKNGTCRVHFRIKREKSTLNPNKVTPMALALP
jgi:hypothetical protein